MTWVWVAVSVLVGLSVVTLAAAWINRPTRGKYRREE